MAISKRNHYPVSSGVQPQLRGSEGQTNSEPYSGRSGSSFGLRHSFGVRHLAFVIVPAIALTYLYAQQDRPDYPRTRATASIGTNRVKITVTGGQRVIEANGWPDHQPGQFPNQGNPNSISEQSYKFNVPGVPQIAAKPVSSARWWFGVAVNGVPFEPGTAEFWNGDNGRYWNYEAKGGFINLGLDENNAHVQPRGEYHYHGLPAGLIERLGGDGQKMVLVGWAADGFPIYTAYGHNEMKDARSPLRKMKSSYRVKQGERPDGPGGAYDGRFTADWEYVKGLGDLDECNGRFGVTPEYPEGIYHYHLTEWFPYISRLFKGTPDPSFMKRGPGPGFAGRPGGRQGPPPPEGQGRGPGDGRDFGPPPPERDRD